MERESSFGHRLREARRDRGLSQAALHRLSGVPKTRLSRYENDHILPTLATLERLAHAMDLSTATLLGQRSEREDAFLDAMRKRGVQLPPADQADAMAARVAEVLQLSTSAT